MERARKLQLYVTERQYRPLRQLAGNRRSMAAVVRDLIEQGYQAGPADDSDAFVQWLHAEKVGSGHSETAEQSKRDLYQQPS